MIVMIYFENYSQVGASFSYQVMQQNLFR